MAILKRRERTGIALWNFGCRLLHARFPWIKSVGPFSAGVQLINPLPSSMDAQSDSTNASACLASSMTLSISSLEHWSPSIPGQEPLSGNIKSSSECMRLGTHSPKFPPHESALESLRKDASEGGDTIIAGGGSGASGNIVVHVRIEFADSERGQNSEAEDADARIDSKCGLNNIAKDMASREEGWSSATFAVDAKYESKDKSDAMDCKGESARSLGGLEKNASAS